jgi:hypothetical protein
MRVPTIDPLFASVKHSYFGESGVFLPTDFCLLPPRLPGRCGPATPVPRATHRHEWANPAPAQPTPNRLRVVAAIPEYTVRPLPRSNAGQTCAIQDVRPSAFWPTRVELARRFDKIPQRIWKQRGSHMRSRYLADGDQASEVLLHALGAAIAGLSAFARVALRGVHRSSQGLRCERRRKRPALRPRDANL